jgi:hypothetical protein
MPAAKRKIDTDELYDRLEKHVCKDGANGHGFAFLTNVRNGTGFQRREGYADAIAMELTKSRGLKLNGFELKVSRNDWLKELKNPHKAEFFWEHCDRWFLVVGDKDIVQEGELPDTWGLIAPRGNGLTVVKAAPINENVKPIADRLFLASLLRAGVSAAPSRRKLEEVRKTAYEEGKAHGEQSRSYNEEEVRELRETIKKFEQESGVSITAWYQGGKPDEVGAALKLVLKGQKDADRILGRLARLGGDIEALLDTYGIDKENPPPDVY